MNKTLNEKGFTLVEVLAVLVILVAIMGIAIPSISSSLERTKAKQNDARYKIIESAAEQYVTDHKNRIYTRLNNNSKNSCYIEVGTITQLSADEMEDADGNLLSGYYVVFTRAHSNGGTQVPTSYDFIENGDKGATISCIN